MAYCYREIHRVLKPGGIFAVTNQNLLFEAFALNDGALRFWAKIMADFSPVDELLGKSVLDALEEHVRVPQRKYDQRSVSQTITPYSENPLTYRETAAKFGFELEKILFPDNNLLPSFLENTLDQEKLWAMKSRVCHSPDMQTRSHTMSRLSPLADATVIELTRFVPLAESTVCLASA